MDTYQYKHGDRPLEGYTIERAAGRGGFGEVYYAISDSGRQVALKVIQSYEQIELRGISQCMNLKSPHLVSVFDVRHNDQGKPFVIMEYVSGPSLADLLKESSGGIGTQKAAFFLREIGKGLSFLHECGIVHRDLKPGNIFYENGYVKIGDYGLTKAMTTSPHVSHTITVGTVHYMAPEIGTGRYDHRVDIYALGVVLYEMLTGRLPFGGADPIEILMKHMATAADVSDLEEPFAHVVQKALAKGPTDRYQNIQAMVEDVFGTEHVRNSVSQFAPEELTVVANRVAQNIQNTCPTSVLQTGTEDPAESHKQDNGHRWLQSRHARAATVAAVLGIGIIGALSMWQVSNGRTLRQAQRLLDAEDGAATTRLLKDASFLPWNLGAKQRFLSDANRLQDYQKASIAAKEGDYERVKLLATRHANDGSFMPLLDESLRVAHPRFLRDANAALATASYQEVVRLCELYQGDASFDGIFTRARDEALLLAESAALKGDSVAISELYRIFPNEKAFSDILIKADLAAKRVARLDAARSMAAKGNTAEIEAMLRDYPDDPAFLEVLRVARKKRTDDLDAARIARERCDFSTVFSLWKNHSEDSEFSALLRDARQDGDYCAVEIDELSSDKGAWDGSRVRICGRVVERQFGTKRTAGIKTNTDRVIVQSLHGESSVRVSAEGADWEWFSKDFGKIRLGETVTVWGLFQGLVIKGVPAFAQGQGFSMVKMNADLRAASDALKQGDTEQAYKLQLPYYWPTGQKFLLWIQDVQQEKRFGALPRDGLYAVVTGQQLNEFRDRLHNKKIRMAGLVTSNRDGYSHCNFVTHDGVRLSGGLVFPESRHDRKALQQICDGTNVTIWGLFVVKKGVFSTSWRVDPVEKFQVTRE